MVSLARVLASREGAGAGGDQQLGPLLDQFDDRIDFVRGPFSDITTLPEILADQQADANSLVIHDRGLLSWHARRAVRDRGSQGSSHRLADLRGSLARW